MIVAICWFVYTLATSRLLPEVSCNLVCPPIKLCVNEQARGASHTANRMKQAMIKIKIASDLNNPIRHIVVSTTHTYVVVFEHVSYRLPHGAFVNGPTSEDGWIGVDLVHVVKFSTPIGTYTPYSTNLLVD